MIDSKRAKVAELADAPDLGFCDKPSATPDFIGVSCTYAVPALLFDTCRYRQIPIDHPQNHPQFLQ